VPLAVNNGRYWTGVDLGSVSLKLVVINDSGKVECSAYRRSRGRPLETLRNVMVEECMGLPEFSGVVVTGSGRNLLANLPGAGISPKNEILAQARAAAALTPDVRTIIEIGGQDAKLILLKPDPGNGRLQVRDHALNDVCAAGTGSFLEQQAARLGIEAEELGALAAGMSNPAAIAGRCSVFAKSDMMHLQQQGVLRNEILEGLCLALARNFISTIARGRQLETPVNFQGGVAANAGVVAAFEHELDLPRGSIRIPPHFMVTGAFGAALFAMDGQGSSMTPVTPATITEAIDWRLDQNGTDCSARSPAARKHPKFPKIKPYSVSTGHHERKGETFPSLPFSENGACDAYLGVDVGSASTKMAAIDSSGRILESWYRLNQGNSLDSVQRGLLEFGGRLDRRMCIRGAGITGSGRHLIGALLGADSVVNEISAQAAAAQRLDPGIDTLFEIGGQDSKYIRFDHGVVTDFEMNKACAAGTGSFLEEQSARLGIDVETDFARLAQDAEMPCDLGTRCTVFMESDLIHHQQNGSRLEDLVAGLAYGVVFNYLEKVVGRRRIGDRIYLQGGVAGNAAVSGALTRALGKPIIVSPFYRVTGAYGAALFAMEKMSCHRKQTLFRGFEADHSQFEIRRFICKGCSNMCRVSGLRLESGEWVYFGATCNRYDSSGQKAHHDEKPDLFRKRGQIYKTCTPGKPRPGADRLPGNKEKVVGLPRSLFYFYTLPLWKTFLSGLGFRVAISAPTDPDIYRHASRETRSDTCMPVKLCYGHVEELLSRGVETIFMPAELEQLPDKQDGPRSFHCPYIPGAPYMMRAAFGTRARIVTTGIYMSGDRENMLGAMKDVAQKLNAPPEYFAGAAKTALQAQSRFEAACTESGQKILAHAGRRSAVVLLGKPHHLYDDGQNMQVDQKLRSMGITAIPYDFLPLGEAALPKSWDNVGWKNARDLMRAAILSVRLGLPTILLTNFGCGPDSFVAGYLEEILQGHPHLHIEMDEHTADAGLITRLEAFLDTAQKRPTPRTAFVPKIPVLKRLKKNAAPFKPSPELLRTLKGRTLYIPHICNGLNEVLAAALHGAGIHAKCLPPQDEGVEELGRKHAGGNECHPFILTTGDLARLVERTDFAPDESAFFMLNYDGACRLGQFSHSHKLFLNRMGFGQVPVVAPITGTRSEEFTRLFGMHTTQALWKGWLATELLLRRLYATRPYELVPGASDAAYAAGVREMANALADASFSGYFFDRRFMDTLCKALDEIHSVPVRHVRDRPRIGIIGEFFTELNSYANQNLVHRLESLGAEVVPQGFMITNVLIYYYGHYYARQRFRSGSLLPAIYYDAMKRWIVHWAHRIGLEGEKNGEAAISRMLMPEEIERAVRGNIHSDIDPVSSLFIARFRDFTEKGVDGICCPIVLNCMLGNMVQPVFRRMAEDNGSLPLLFASFDGLKQTNLQTRLEAFVEQARARRLSKNKRKSEYAF